MKAIIHFDAFQRVEPLICIDRSSQPQTIIPGKSHQLQELEREHMRPVRTKYRERERDKEKEKKRNHIHSCQWGEYNGGSCTKSLIYHSPSLRGYLYWET